MKTVKELEKQLNISKVSIYSMLKKAEFKDHTFKGDKNITLIDEIGEELLKAYYLKEQSQTLNNIILDELKQEEITSNSKSSSKDSDEIKKTDIIMILQKQLETKDEQIKNLLNIVLNQQKLQGAQLLTHKTNVVNTDTEIKESKQKKFWNTLFKK